MNKRTDHIKIIGINLTLALSLYGLVNINKTILRPTFSDSQFTQILTGSFPSFIAGLLLCLCVVNPVLIKKPKSGRTIVYAISLLIMFMLILDEIKSLAASTQYDFYDIIGSIAGSVLAIITFEYLYHRQNNN